MTTRKSDDPQSITFPRARAAGLIVRKLDNEVLVYDRERDQATCLNAFAGQVWERCNGRTSPAAIAHTLAQANPDLIDERAVWLALDQLGRSRLLEQSCPIPASMLGGTSRRELLRTLGIGAAAAVPAVASIMVPPAAAQVSCFADGAGCAVDNQCCSFNCNGGICGGALQRRR